MILLSSQARPVKGESVTTKDYSQRDVVDKLGIKPGHVVAFATHAQSIDATLRQNILKRTGSPVATSEATDAANEADEVVDVALVTVDEKTDVVEALQYWRRRLRANGGIWLLTAKRGQAGYVDQQELIIAGKQAGVVDNKVCSVSPTTSAMRFVIRKADRLQEDTR